MPVFKMDSFAWLTLFRVLPGLASIALAILAHPHLAASALIVSVWSDAALGFFAKKCAWDKQTIHKQLDTVIDLICFIWAPVQLVMALSVAHWVLIPAVLFVLAGCFRIARFNTEGLVNGRYRGLPVTYNGYIFPLANLVAYNAPSLNGSILFAVVFLFSSSLMATTRISVPEF